MSSLPTKIQKRRSNAASAARPKNTRKATAKKQPSKKRVAAPSKAKKVAVKAVTKKASTPKRSVAKSARPTAKKAAPLSKRKAPAKAARTSAKRKIVPVSRASRTRQVAAVKPQPEPKRQPSPRTLSAIRAFEAGLKLFNRQDYAAARTALNAILMEYGEQPEISSPVRTYLAICEQKLAKSSSPGKDVEALYNQGVFELNRGNTMAAIQIFERALKLDNRADHVLYSLAAAYGKAGQPTRAIESLRRAIALHPGHRSYSRHDPDFAPLKNNLDFQRLVGLDIDLS